ncbi:MAG: Gfo/Idh/MocA family protein [Candidatus Binataceae bacterium]
MAGHTQRQLRVGIVGAGLIGRVHSMMLREVAKRTGDSVRVVAVADVDHAAAQRLAKHWPNARIATAADEIITDSSIDAIWICTPTRHHRAACIAAARAGKHIFAEKPLAMTSAEAQEMAEAIRSAGVLSQVGLVLRFSPIYTVMRAMLAEPIAGRTLAVVMRDDQDFPIRGVHASGWRNDPSLTAGGTLVEHSVHDFDLLSWMCGPVAAVSCRTRNLSGARGVEDFGSVEFEFAGGFSAHLTSVWHKMIGRPSNRRLEIIAENLFVASDFDSTGTMVVQRGDGREETIGEAEVMRRFEQVLLAERPYLAPVRELLAMPYALEDAAFLAAMRGECRVDPEFRVGVAAQRMVEAAYESARTCAVVEVRNES